MENGKTTYKDGQESHERETTLDKQLAKLVSNDVREAMAKLTWYDRIGIYKYRQILVW